jgi:formate dehydrogenase
MTDDKEGLDCELEKHIPDLHVLISTHFHPTYMTTERIMATTNAAIVSAVIPVP